MRSNCLEFRAFPYDTFFLPSLFRCAIRSCLSLMVPHFIHIFPPNSLKLIVAQCKRFSVFFPTPYSPPISSILIASVVFLRFQKSYPLRVFFPLYEPPFFYVGLPSTKRRLRLSYDFRPPSAVDFLSLVRHESIFYSFYPPVRLCRLLSS